MTWTPYVDNTFKQAQVNEVGSLNDSLKELSDQLQILKYGYIELGPGETAAAGDFTEAALTTTDATAGASTINQNVLQRVLRGTKLSSIIDVIRWGWQVPSDAAANTAAKFYILYHCDDVADNLVSKFYYTQKHWSQGGGTGGTTDSSNWTYTNSAANSSKVQIQELDTDEIDPGDRVVSRVYRDADDVADTQAAEIFVYGAYIKYERTT